MYELRAATTSATLLGTGKGKGPKPLRPERTHIMSTSTWSHVTLTAGDSQVDVNDIFVQCRSILDNLSETRVEWDGSGVVEFEDGSAVAFDFELEDSSDDDEDRAVDGWTATFYGSEGETGTTAGDELTEVSDIDGLMSFIIAADKAAGESEK